MNIFQPCPVQMSISSGFSLDVFCLLVNAVMLFFFLKAVGGG